ncbi:MAG: hypothetical protein ACOC0P_01625 [Planctomycetota bacterium]
MLRKFFCLSAGLALASTAMAAPSVQPMDTEGVKRIHIEVGPDMVGRVVDEAPVRPNEVRFVYFATDPSASSFWDNYGGNAEPYDWADDTHHDGMGPLTSMEFWMQPNQEVSVTYDFTIDVFENDADNTDDPDFSSDPLIAIFADEVGPLDPGFSYFITLTFTDGPDLPMDTWTGWKAWEDFDPNTGTGTIAAPDPVTGFGPAPIIVDPPNPTIGTSEDFFFADIEGVPGRYFFNGDPQAVFGISYEADAASSGPCLGLDVAQLTAGLPGTFTVTGDPGTTVAVLYSLQTGSFTIGDPGRLGWCVDLGLNLPADPRSQIAAQGQTNSLGEFVATIPIPLPAQGLTVYFQAAAQGTCPDFCSSDVVTRVIGP